MRLKFPQYAFIEPRYFGSTENDQHPPADVRQGEQLIADVYNAIRKNKALWESTLLIVTYDEHGGFYDHVAPPNTVAPDDHTTLDLRPTRCACADHSRLTVDRKVSSRPSSATQPVALSLRQMGPGALGQRIQASAGNKQANTFAEELLTLDVPRTKHAGNIDG